MVMILTVALLDFNPRSREGSDLSFSSSEMATLISIHAPAKGATPSGFVRICAAVNFNPRSREGSDTMLLIASNVLVRFQSTLPRRERLLREMTAATRKYFNPRSREGSDGM